MSGAVLDPDVLSGARLRGAALELARLNGGDIDRVRSVSEEDLGRSGCYRYHVNRGGMIPVDRGAEETLAGCAIDSTEGARLAALRTSREDFHDPRVADVIAAAAGLGPEVERRERLAAIASITGHPVAWLEQVTSNRAVLTDRSGWHSRRVLSAAEVRRRVRRALITLDLLGVDVEPLVCAGARSEQIYGLLVEAAGGLGAALAGERIAGAGQVVDALVGVGRAVGLGDVKELIARALGSAITGVTAT